MYFFQINCFFIILSSCAIAYEVSVVPGSPISIFGQEPHWCEETQQLYYVDANEPLIWCYDFKTGNFYGATIVSALYYLFIIPIIGTKDLFAVGIDKRVDVVRWNSRSSSATSEWTVFEVEKDINSVPRAINKGIADPCNRLFIGTFRASSCDVLPGVVNASVYRYSNCDGVVRLLNDGFSLGSMTWDIERKKLYLVDGCNLVLREYNYDSYTGDIYNEQILYDFRVDGNYPGFIPYSVTIDTTGSLWFSGYGSYQIFKINPIKRQIVQTITLPVRTIGAIGFGGPNLDILYVTTVGDQNSLRYGNDLIANNPPQPNAGCLFQVKDTGARGLPSNKVYML